MERSRRKVLGFLQQVNHAAVSHTSPVKTAMGSSRNVVEKAHAPPPTEHSGSLFSSSSSVSGSSRSETSVYRCRHCQKVCASKTEFVIHKRTEHADEITHITGTPSSVFSGSVLPESTAAELLGQTTGVTTPDNSDPRATTTVSAKQKALAGKNKLPLPIGQKRTTDDGFIEHDRNPKKKGG